MGSRSGGLVCSTCSYTGIRTRRFYTNNNTFPSFSFTFPHQPQSFSFPKPLRLMSQPLTTNSADGDSSVAAPPILFDYHLIDQKLLQNIVYDALVWSTLNCLLVGDKSVQVYLSYCCLLFIISIYTWIPFALLNFLTCRITP